MKVALRQNKAAGFAVVEGLLILVILGAIVGVGAYVMHQRNQANKTLNTASLSIPNSGSSAPAGTTASIDQVTTNGNQAETNVDKSADSQVQGNVSSANNSTTSVGGAYNESSL